MYLFGISHECLYVETHHPSSVLCSRQEMRILLCLELQTTPRWECRELGTPHRCTPISPSVSVLLEAESGGWSLGVLLRSCGTGVPGVIWGESSPWEGMLLCFLTFHKLKTKLAWRWDGWSFWPRLEASGVCPGWGEGDTASPGCVGTTESSWLVMTPGRRWTHVLCLIWRSKRCSCEHPRPSHMFHLLFCPWVEKSSLLLWITPHSISFSFHLFHLFL